MLNLNEFSKKLESIELLTLATWLYDTFYSKAYITELYEAEDRKHIEQLICNVVTGSYHDFYEVEEVNELIRLVEEYKN